MPSSSSSFSVPGARRSASKTAGVTAGESTISPAATALMRALELLGLEAPVDEVAGGAVADRAGDELLVLGVGEHQDLGALRQRAGGGDAVHHRHPDVEADDVGADLAASSIASRPSPASPTTSMPSASASKRGDASPHDRVVVHEQDADHCHVNPSTAPGTVSEGAAGGRRLGAARRWRAGAPGRHPDRDHGAVAGLGLDAQLAARQLRALAHAARGRRAAAGELLEVVGHLEAVAVVGDRQHHAVAEPAQVHVDRVACA